MKALMLIATLLLTVGCGRGKQTEEKSQKETPTGITN
jgi:hypothetical protein